MNATREPGPPASYLRETRAVVTSPAPLAWLTTLDHKRLAILYVIVATLALVAAGAMKFALHLDAASSTVVAFVFLVPSLPATLGNFLLPIQLGQSRAALPRLSLAGFWLYALGVALTLAALELTDGGKAAPAGEMPMVVAALVLSISAALTAINALATVGRALAHGVPSSRITLFGWALCATGIAQIVSALGLAVVLALLMLGKLPLPPALMPTGVGARLLAHPWAYLSPATTLMLVPAVGLFSDIVAAFARRPLAGFGLVATCLTVLAFLGLVAWGFPLLGGGSGDPAMQFGLATSLLAVPSAVVALAWVATLQGGRISLSVPLLWALGFLVVLTVGGVAGMLLGVAPTSVYLHGTIFEVGYRDYVLTAGACMGFAGGLYYAWPKMTGRLYDARVATVAFLLIFVGVHVTFLAELASGLLPGIGVLGELSRDGSWVLGAGALATLINLAVSLRGGAPSPESPWGVVGLEWRTASPPPLDNFREVPSGDVDVPRSTEAKSRAPEAAVGAR